MSDAGGFDLSTVKRPSAAPSSAQPSSAAPTGDFDLSTKKPPAPTESLDITKAVGRIPEALSAGGSRAAEVLKQRASAIGGMISDATGHLKDVDYSSGTSWTDAMMLARADNDEERRRYLNRAYGKEHVYQDPHGRFYVDAGGKKVAPGSTGFFSGASADIAAQAAPLTGMMAGGARGAAMGARAGLWGALLGGALGGGLGAIPGKTLDEITKELTGLEGKSLSGVIKSIGKESEAGATGEAGGRLVSGLIGRVTRGGLPHFFTGATQESDELTATTLRGGAVPPIRSTGPSMGVTKWHEALSRNLVGPFNEERNLQFIQGEIKDALEEIGVRPENLDAAMADINETTAAAATKELGASLGSKVAEHQELLAKTVTSAQEGANEALTRDMAEVNRLGKVKRPPGDLATDVADKIIGARQDFSKSANRVFEHVDSLFGDAPIIPTRVVKRRAEELAKSLPKERFALVHELAALPDKIKPSEMQSYVTKLRELGEPEDLAASGVTKHEWRLLKKMADASFEDGVRGGSVDPRAMNALQGARKWYQEGIRKFEDATFNKEIDSIKTGMPPNPSVIAKMLLKPGYDSRAIELRNVVGGEVWSRVGTEYLRGLIADASRAGQLNGARLRSILGDQGGLLDIAVGRKAADAARSMADRAAALEGKLPLTALDPADSMLGNIERLNKAVDVQEMFLKDNFLSELARPGFMHDEALNFVVKPGQSERLKAAFDWFGEGSDAVAEIRQTFVTQLLKQSMTETQSGIKTVDPDKIFHNLRSYTKEQQGLLMPAGLDDDIKMIARHARFLFPRAGSDMSAGLAAGAIKSALPFGTVGKAMGLASGGSITGLALSAYAYAVGWGWILSRPTTVKWIAQGLNGDTAARRAASHTMQSIFDAAALGLIPDTTGVGEQ